VYVCSIVNIYGKGSSRPTYSPGPVRLGQLLSLMIMQCVLVRHLLPVQYLYSENSFIFVYALLFYNTFQYTYTFIVPWIFNAQRIFSFVFKWSMYQK